MLYVINNTRIVHIALQEKQVHNAYIQVEELKKTICKFLLEGKFSVAVILNDTVIDYQDVYPV